MAASCGRECGSDHASEPTSTSVAAPEVIRAANRLSTNEGERVVLEGLAVEVADRACIHLDRMDAIVPVAGRRRWEAHLRDRVVRGRGRLSRHAFANDPDTGISSLELAEASVEEIVLPADGRIRTAPALRAAEGAVVEVEGMAYLSFTGPIIIVYGGLAYVRGFPDWNMATAGKTIVVRGTVRHPPLPPGAPQAGGSWAIEATGWELVPAR